MSEYRYRDGDTSYYGFGGEVYPIGFKIFYGDNTVYSAKGVSEELKTAWDEAPNQDVQIVVLYENTIDAQGRHTRVLYSGVDYYIFDGGTFTFTNDIHNGTVLYGKWGDDEDFQAIRDIALTDYEL